ncbi:hypothetical protein [Streptomyces sp. NPDC094468]|uniref:hypothetical protein n=1 Tax=Streptomyces sp. NPDC094468 TaxID=3366066 RepID=UPI003802A1B9
MTASTASLDDLVPRVRAWATVLISPAWWRLPSDDRYAHRSGVELALWTDRQIRRSGLCPSCWFRESERDVLFCEGGSCHTFTRLLGLLA